MIRSAVAAAVVLSLGGLLGPARPASAATEPAVSYEPGVSSDPVAYAAALNSPDWVKTPAGLMRKECVHTMPAGATFAGGSFVYASGRRDAITPCTQPRLVQRAEQTPATNGWLIDTWADASTWERRLYAYYAVPAAPATNGAITFIFSSMENAAGNTIVQPVLTYGTNGSRGGNYWYINSWYVWPGGSVIGGTVRVSTGDTIWGAMEGNDCASDGTGCHWAIRTVDQNTGGESRIDVTSGVAYRNAQGGVLESYGAAGCAMLPSNKHLAFRNIQVFGPTFNLLTPSWRTEVRDQECGMTETSTTTSADINWTVG